MTGISRLEPPRYRMMMAEDSVNGAESLVRTLVASRVDTCYADPGTSEMHFVAALDRARGTLSTCSFEGVATGAEDGYARHADSALRHFVERAPGTKCVAPKPKGQKSLAQG
jgi:acetolactate synthase I/II/III large subunit